MPGLTLPSPGARRLRLAALTLGAVLVLGWAMWLPSAFPSSSLLYKFGADRFMLIAGKAAGMALLFVMTLQLILMARPPFLERAAGFDRLVRWHRLFGVATVVLAIVHPLLVFAPEDVAAMPLQWEYWPEVLGCALLLALALSAAASLRRREARLPYHIWKAGHFFGAAGLLAGGLVHVYYVTDSFHAGQPFWFLVGVGVAALVSWGWIALGKLTGGAPYVVESVRPAGATAREIQLRPESRAVPHSPGQFAVLRPWATHLTREAHPFTIASGPDEEGLRFVIRCSGDWTDGVGVLAPGDRFRVDGPLGLFSPAAYQPGDPAVCIAGGVGATPMLSMIRSMTADSPPLHFIWANRSREDVFHAEILAALQDELPQFRVTHVLSRDPNAGEPYLSGRLDRDVLEALLPETERAQHRYFVCGPPKMMAAVIDCLRELGVPDSRIVSEEFGF